MEKSHCCQTKRKLHAQNIELDDLLVYLQLRSELIEAECENDTGYIFYSGQRVMKEIEAMKTVRHWQCIMKLMALRNRCWRGHLLTEVSSRTNIVSHNGPVRMLHAVEKEKIQVQNQRLGGRRRRRLRYGNGTWYDPAHSWCKHWS